MRITVTPKGPGFDRLIADTTRDLQAATRGVGPAVAKAVKPVDAPTWNGRRLGVKTTVRAGASKATVTVSPGSDAGEWSILESGARPHRITSRRAMPLGGNRFATSVRHPGVRGKGRWTKVARASEPKIDKAIESTFDKAMV